ncbi:hypothetical protein DFH07DRAFT_972383 [Mycena maculata]|uniref:Uncharacterized protein n=1 Tax=Mycena maculata TaxID=230809 RepID=A0AAD7MKE7_9AGAR|nr:hypothetical protein DFH07DRAFT_972383 [Mycena maculata]
MSSTSRPSKHKLEVPSQEELRAAFDHDHWALFRANSSFVKAIAYFDRDFTQVTRADTIQLFELLEPTLDFIYQIYVLFDSFCRMFPGLEQDHFSLLKEAFRDRDPPQKWFDEEFTIPEAHKHVENPFSQPPVSLKTLVMCRAPSAPPPTKKVHSAQAVAEPDSGSDLESPPTENPGLRHSIRDTKRPPQRPSSPPSKAKSKPKPKGLSVPEVVLSSHAAGKQPDVASSPVPLSSIAHEQEPNDDSDNDSIQIISENASSSKPVPTLGELDPKAIGQANSALKPSKAQLCAPSVAHTVVAKHLVTSAGLPAEDIQSLFPCFSCITRGYTCIYAGPGRRCFNCQKNGQTCNHAGKAHPSMVALDRLEPDLSTTSRRFIAHLKQISRTGRLVQLHQDLVATYIRQYLDGLKEFAFEFFQAEMALPAAHFHARFADAETKAEIKALFAQFNITFADSLEHFKNVNELGDVFENNDGEAIHQLPLHPSLESLPERVDPSIMPKSVHAIELDSDHPPSDHDLSQVMLIHRVVNLCHAQGSRTPNGRTMRIGGAR